MAQRSRNWTEKCALGETMTFTFTTICLKSVLRQLKCFCLVNRFFVQLEHFQVRNRFPSPINSWGTNSRNVTYRNVPVAIDSKTTIGASIVFPSPIFVIKRPTQTPNGAINEKIHIAVQRIFFFGSFNYFISNIFFGRSFLGGRITSDIFKTTEL